MDRKGETIVYHRAGLYHVDTSGLRGFVFQTVVSPPWHTVRPSLGCHTSWDSVSLAKPRNIVHRCLQWKTSRFSIHKSSAYTAPITLWSHQMCSRIYNFNSYWSIQPRCNCYMKAVCSYNSIGIPSQSTEIKEDAISVLLIMLDIILLSAKNYTLCRDVIIFRNLACH